MNNDTAQEQAVRMMTMGQYKDLSAAALQAIPANLSFEQAENALARKKDFAKHINSYFQNQTVDMIKEWEMFYGQFFGKTVDLSRVKIPERTERQQKEFTRLIIVYGFLMSHTIYEKSVEVFGNSCHHFRWYGETGDQYIPINERGDEGETYAIWVRDEDEPDPKYMDMPADSLLRPRNWIEKARKFVRFHLGINTYKSFFYKKADLMERRLVKTETLKERLIHGLKYFIESGRHLDTLNTTLCAGSRYTDDCVPIVGARNGQFDVYWFYQGENNINVGARQVVACN